jgi:hypothetical protein
MILVLFIAYFPESKKYVSNIGSGDGKEHSTEWRISRLVAASFLFHFFFTLIFSVCLYIFVGGGEQRATRYWADLLGIISLLLASVQYLPQIWKTWQRKVLLLLVID